MTTDAAVSGAGAHDGLAAALWQRFGPALVVVAGLIALWYLVALPVNGAQLEAFEARRNPDHAVTSDEWMAASWTMRRPSVPVPDRIVADFAEAITVAEVSHPRNLLFHVFMTFTATLIGFAMGAVLGIALAVGIVSLRTLDVSLMPWLIASQTIPILAIAPMLITVLGAMGLTGLFPKAIIAMYLCFFPVTVGMVKGLRAPDHMNLDLMRTYSATGAQVLWKLRFPASVPFLFTSLKIAIALGLVGTMVAELSTGGQVGLGGRLLTASYNGLMVHMWTVLITSSVLAIVLVAAVGWAERLVVKRGGASGAQAR